MNLPKVQTPKSKVQDLVGSRSGVQRSMLLLLLSGLWALGFGLWTPSSFAAQTNSPSRPDFSAFKNIAANNIFNTRRSLAYVPSERRQTLRTSKTECFALVGTMNYGDGPMAFFEGSKSDFRKVLKPDETIAIFKLIGVETSSVKLASPTNEVELQIGMQLCREEEGPWKVSARPESAEPSAPRLASSRSSYQANVNRTGSESSAPATGEIPQTLPDGSPLPLFFQDGAAPFGPGQAEPQTGANNNRPTAASGGSDSDILARLAARAAAERRQ